MTQRLVKTTLDCRPLTGSCGAVIKDIKLKPDMAENHIEEIRRAIDQYKVILIPNQDFSSDEFKQFGALFGNLLSTQFKNYRDEDKDKEILLIRTEQQHDNVFGYKWHMDASYWPTIVKYPILYCKIVPKAGGDTVYSNLQVAYEHLSPAMQNFLMDLQAVHSSAKLEPQYSGYDVKLAIHDTKKPIVRICPRTGQKALCINNEEQMISIEGLKKTEGTAIIRFLNSHVIQEEFSCRVRHEVGQVVIWDNPSVLHRAIDDYKEEREMLRISVGQEKILSVREKISLNDNA